MVLTTLRLKTPNHPTHTYPDCEERGKAIMKARQRLSEHLKSMKWVELDLRQVGGLVLIFFFLQ